MLLPVLGIDIAKRKFNVALLRDGKFKDKVFPNTPEGHQEMLTWLKRQEVERVHACLEATGTYAEAVATVLADAGHLVSLVNPSRIQGFAQSHLARSKNDLLDARLIARFCEALKPERWAPPAPEVRQLQALVRRLDDLKGMRQMEENRLEAGVASMEVRQSLSEHLAHLDRQIAETEKRIRDHFDQHPGLKSQKDLLTTIPGIGDQTAWTLLSEIRSVLEFRSARQLAAFSGLTPREHQSGSSVKGRTRLSKVGNPRIRKALYMAAMSAVRFNPLIQPFRERLLARGKSKMAIIGAVMRKLLHQAYGVLKSQRPFDPSLA